MKHRSGQYESIQQRNCDAERVTPLDVLEHATRPGAVQHEIVIQPGMNRGNDKGLLVFHKPHMADEGFVKNAIDDILVVVSALGQAPDPIAFVLGKLCHGLRPAVSEGVWERGRFHISLRPLRSLRFQVRVIRRRWQLRLSILSCTRSWLSSRGEALVWCRVLHEQKPAIEIALWGLRPLVGLPRPRG